MTIKNEAARLFFAITALILVTMLSSPPTDSSLLTLVRPSLKREIASTENVNKKNKEVADKKISRKLVKKT